MDWELTAKAVLVLAFIGMIVNAVRSWYWHNRQREAMQNLVDIYAEAARRRAQENG